MKHVLNFQDSRPNIGFGVSRRLFGLRLPGNFSGAEMKWQHRRIAEQYFLFQPDPGIKNGVQQIGHQIDDHKQQSTDKNQSFQKL